MSEDETLGGIKTKRPGMRRAVGIADSRTYSVGTLSKMQSV